MMDALIDERGPPRRKWQQDRQIVDESIRRGGTREAMRAEHSLTSTVGKGKGFFAREPNKQAKSSMYYLSLDRSTFRSIALLSWLAGCSSSRTSLRRHHPLSCHSCLGGERGASRLPYSFLSAFRAPPPPLFPLQKQQRGLPSFHPSLPTATPACGRVSSSFSSSHL